MQPNPTRRQLRGGPPTDADRHWVELIGSTELSIFRHPNNKLGGYEALKTYLESQGCQVLYTANSPNPISPSHHTILITGSGAELSAAVLKRAHGWAHRRNLSHTFFKPSAAATDRP